jgi:hypothetical protein
MNSVARIGSTNDLASTILKNFDKDGNGSLSADEFGSFLNQLMGSIKQTPARAAASPATRSVPTLFPSASAAAAAPRARLGDMLGFDENKLANTEHVTFKYQVGRILQHYPSTPDGLRQALGEIQQLAPNAKIIGTNGDKIDFGEYNDPKAGKIGVIDVLVGAASGGRGWAWQPVE